MGRLLGVKTTGEDKEGKVSKLTKDEILMLNIGSMSTGARVMAVKIDKKDLAIKKDNKGLVAKKVKKDLATLQLVRPVCTSKGEKIALSRRVDKHWRLIGWGEIRDGQTLDIPPCSI